jgi:hypothetical protein
LDQLAEIDLPANFPLSVTLETGVPLPPDVSLADIMAFPGSKSYTYEYETGLNIDDVLAYYQAFKPVDGWEVSEAMKSPSGISVLVVLKKDGQQAAMLHVQVNPYNQKDIISFKYPPQ